MKTRKTLSHTLLVSELYNQLKFPVKVWTILVFFRVDFHLRCILQFFHILVSFLTLPHFLLFSQQI